MDSPTTKIGAQAFERLFDFFDGLRASGYEIDARQVSALNDLLLVLIARGENFGDFARLKTQIAPLVCSTPAEQEDFYGRFERWSSQLQFERAAAEAPKPTPVEPQPRPARKFPTRQVLQGLGLLILVLLVIWVLLVVWSTLFSMWGQTAQTTPWGDYIFLILGIIIAAGWLGWRSWKTYQENQYITRQLTNLDVVYDNIPVEGYDQDLLPVLSFKPVVSSLRRRVQIASADVDVEKTIETAFTRNNWLEIVYRQHQVTPEYVVLIDRKSRLDQQARFVQELLAHLQSDGVFLHLYEFSGDPRICFPFDRKDAPLHLNEVQSRHPDARLLVFSGASELLNPLTGQLQGWLTPLTHWRERAILTPGKVHTFLLDALQSQDFVVLPMTLDGLAALVRSFERDNASFPSQGGETSLPAALTERPLRWTGRDALPDAEVKAILAELRAYLGENGFYWLCACAVYPELRWELTLYLGSMLKGNEEQSLLDVNTLLRMARLPWFRAGYMPDWIRDALVESFLPVQEIRVHNVLSKSLANTDKEEGFDLVVARNKAKSFGTRLQKFMSALIRNSAKDSDLRDEVFVKFLINPNKRKLSVSVSKRYDTGLRYIKALRDILPLAISGFFVGTSIGAAFNLISAISLAAGFNIPIAAIFNFSTVSIFNFSAASVIGAAMGFLIGSAVGIYRASQKWNHEYLEDISDPVLVQQDTLSSKRGQSGQQLQAESREQVSARKADAPVQPNSEIKEQVGTAQSYSLDNQPSNPPVNPSGWGAGSGSTILIDGGIVHYQAVGRGRPVVFLHGWLGSWRYWFPSMQYLTAASFRSYALDFWGFGDSARETTRYSIEQQSILLDHFLQEMGIGKVALVGHGLGALVGMSYAMRHPNVVDRIMAVDMPLDIESVNMRLRAAPIPDLVNWLLTRDPASEPVRTDAIKADPLALSTSFSSPDSFSIAGRIANLNTACLLVYGQNDPAIAIPNFDSGNAPPMLQTVIIDQTGHFPMLDDARRFNLLLSAFMALESGQSPRDIQLKDVRFKH